MPTNTSVMSCLVAILRQLDDGREIDRLIRTVLVTDGDRLPVPAVEEFVEIDAVPVNAE